MITGDEFYFEFIGAISEIATIGAFIYLILSNKDTREHLNKLDNIVDTLSKTNIQYKQHLKAEYMPILKMGALNCNMARHINFIMTNGGKTCCLTNVKSLNENWIVENPKTRASLITDHTEAETIFLRTDNPTVWTELEFNIEIDYEDLVGNKYVAKITGSGPSPKFECLWTF